MKRCATPLFAAALAFGLLLSNAAEAQLGTIAIGDFSGPRSGTLRSSIARVLSGDGYEIVSSSSNDPEEIASETNAGAIIIGSMRRRSGRWRANVQIFDAAGNSVGRVSGRARRIGSLGSQLSRRIQRSLPEMDGSSPGPSRRDEEEEEDEPVELDGERRVVVRAFEGRGSSRIRSRFVRALSRQRNIELVPRRRYDRAANGSGRAAVRAGAREVGAHAVVDGEVERGRGRWTLTLRVYEGASGQEISTIELRERNRRRLERALPRGVQQLLGPLSDANAPEVEERDDDDDEYDDDDEHDDDDEYEDDDEHDEDSSDGDADEERLFVALDLMIAAKPFGRILRYNDDLYDLLREYTLVFGPAVLLGGRWYPGAHFSNGFIAHIGLEATWEQAFGITSTRSDGTRFPTRSNSFYLGLRGRYPMDGHEFSLGVGYGGHSFEIEPSGIAGVQGRSNIPRVPGVGYRYIKTELEARLRVLGGFRFTARGGWLFMLDAGGIGEDVWFPRQSVGGVTVGLELGYELDMGLEIRLGWDLRRYFFSMNPEPGDPFIVGGALDQYFGYTLGIAYRL